MDSILRDLLAVDTITAFNFFSESLQDVLKNKKFDPDQMVYVASVLAHYAINSCEILNDCTEASHLGQIYEFFVLRELARENSKMYALGGAQLLVFGGFYRHHMSTRHNLGYYDQLGQSFYSKAGRYTVSPKERRLFEKFSENFPWWTHVCSDLQKSLSDKRFLLNCC